MKIFLVIVVLISAASQAHARDVSAFNSRDVKAVLNKLGTGLVYHNDRAVIRKARTCALLQQEFATEATERDVLVIGYAGDPIPYNDFGVNPHGTTVRNETLWEAGVYYDAATAETKTAIDGGVRYEVCYGKSAGAFAQGCTDENVESRTSVEITKDKVVMTSEYRQNNGSMERWKSTCEF